jgi:CheY-like chemotaxis protein
MPRVLIIDDDVEIVALLGEVLRSDGHEVDSASEPAEGIQKARRFKPELIILDYHMPGCTGAHLFESLRRNNSTRSTPILFVSGEATPEHILSEISESEGSRFLPKPLKIADLRKAIREMIPGRGTP